MAPLKLRSWPTGPAEPAEVAVEMSRLDRVRVQLALRVLEDGSCGGPPTDAAAMLLLLVSASILAGVRTSEGVMARCCCLVPLECRLRRELDAADEEEGSPGGEEIDDEGDDDDDVEGAEVKEGSTDAGGGL